MDFITELQRNITKRKEELLKEAIIAAGLENIINTLSDRFPRIKIEHKDNAEYYFADDGTPEGKFIIGFKVSSEMSSGQYTVVLNEIKLEN